MRGGGGGANFGLHNNGTPTGLATPVFSVTRVYPEHPHPGVQSATLPTTTPWLRPDLKPLGWAQWGSKL